MKATALCAALAALCFVGCGPVEPHPPTGKWVRDDSGTPVVPGDVVRVAASGPEWIVERVDGGTATVIRWEVHRTGDYPRTEKWALWRETIGLGALTKLRWEKPSP